MLQIIIPKLKNEPLGVVIVESGWGSMVPTIVLASMAPGGAAARCSQLNVGDQIMSVNGVSLVGLPLSTCQNYVKVPDLNCTTMLVAYFMSLINLFTLSSLEQIAVKVDCKSGSEELWISRLASLLCLEYVRFILVLAQAFGL